VKKINTYHIPALLNEAISLLNVRSGGRYIDATLGGGGHSEGIIRSGGELLALDVDIDAIEFASKRLLEVFEKNKETCTRLPKVVRENFADIDRVARENDFGEVDGIIYDLGVSSHQLEEEGRGFSFNQAGLLDMRMDDRLTVRAKDLVNGLSENELVELFSKLGEEKFSRRFAKAIVGNRREKPITTCDELAQVILRVAPERGRLDRTHPATRVFQALRIAVNDEINNLKVSLPKGVNLLKKHGRLVILSFHSLEDGVVKRFFLEMEKDNILKVITKNPIVPEREEIINNPRARSAKLRAAERI